MHTSCQGFQRPQQQLQQKHARSCNLTEQKDKLQASLREEFSAKKEIEKLIAEHDKDIGELLAKVEAKQTEIDRLNTESLVINE